MLKSGEADRLVCYFFDLLYLDGHDLTAVPLIARKTAARRNSRGDALAGAALLASISTPMANASCSKSAGSAPKAMVSKRRDAPYRSGRSREWIKSKCANRQEFVIGGFVPSTTSRKAIGSLVLGYYAGGELIHAGRVGTGFSSRMAADLYADLERDRVGRALSRARSPPRRAAMSSG